MADGPHHPKEVEADRAAGRYRDAELADVLIESVGNSLPAVAGRGILAHMFSVLPKVGMAETDLSPAGLDWLADECLAFDVALEVNERWACPSPSTLAHFMARGVRIVCATDSHRAETIASTRRSAASSTKPPSWPREQSARMSEPLKRQTVLVTGAGGPAGVSVIQALRALGHATVGADASADAVGIRLADAGGVLPRAEDADYASALCTLAAEHGVTSLIPTVAEELVALHDCSGVLSAAGIAYWLPSPRAVVSCTDKWLFHQAATAAGTAYPRRRSDDEGVTGPWVIKPRHGRGSRDIYFSMTRTRSPSWSRSSPTRWCSTGSRGASSPSTPW